MSKTPPPTHGFSLSSVCWGYREIFANALQGLFDQGWIGDERPAVTEAFFDLMRCAEHQHFDYVLKEFLGALNPQTAWLLDLPSTFAEVTEMGRELAETKLHYGIAYFRTLGEGGFGDTPQRVRTLITTLKRLRAVDDDLALALLAGYRQLAARLTPAELEAYLQHGLRAFHQNRKTGLRFMEGTLKSSEAIIQGLTQEARLQDLAPGLEKLLRALVGYDVAVGELGRLDSDELIERGTNMVCMPQWLYAPLRMRYFDLAAQNRNWYRLLGVVAAGALALNSFSRIHGHPDFQTCADLVGNETATLNAFQIIEYVRILRGIRRMWPGARRLVDFGLETAQAARPPVTPDEQLFFDAARVVPPQNRAVRALHLVADASVNAFDTASLITPDLLNTLTVDYPYFGHTRLRPFAFLPDFLYPGDVNTAIPQDLVADLKQQAKQRQQEREQNDDDAKAAIPPNDAPDQVGDGTDEVGDKAIPACYLYDEWSQDENAYYENYCHVYEKRLPVAPARPIPAHLADLAARTRRAFELLRPEISKEKYLPEGDTINVDALTTYLVQRRQEPAPRINFYEKPYHNRRDLATVIVLDVSGSTGSIVDRDKTIEIEKQAALILGQGLATLGDRFAITGFSSNGRELCEFFIFKDFDEPWNQTSIAGVLAAYPRSATRIGPALRHAGYRLSSIEARQRFIILITDGKPQDSNYDPHTRYAQHDVRMACEENRRHNIHTFCISTDDNSRADMEIMFPGQLFTILPDVGRLPQVLPRLYIRLTV